MGGSSLCYVTADNSSDQKHCDGGNIFLICHTTPRVLMFKGLCELSPPCQIQ